MFSNQNQITHCLNNSLRIARLHNYRVMLVLAGDADRYLTSVCKTFVESTTACSLHPPEAKPIALPSEVSQNVTPYSDYIMHVPDEHSNSDISDEINVLLGSEHACVIFDATNAFNERLFAAAAGTIVSGGLLVLKAPPLHDWASRQAGSAQNDHSLFIARFCEKLAAHQSQSVLPVENPETHTDKPEDTAFLIAASTPDCSTQRPDKTQKADWKIEQDAMLNTLADTLLGKQGSVCVVQGDRGRGKSTLIGRALKKVWSTESINHGSVSITANRRSACAILLQHADHPIPFISIDAALTTTHELLVVEEAGSIPIPVLERLMNQSQSIVFATTVQGYEGAGRGFAIRFAKKLDAVKPGWLKLNPILPIRWSTGDPVEAFVNDALLLETTLPGIELCGQHSLVPLTPDLSQVSLIDKQELSTDDALLSEVYGLLVQAHYQTTPADLRNLLDQPRLLLFVQRTNQTITGAALVALEGDIATDLHQHVMHKKRRLANQILPQLLAQSSGEAHVLTMQFARVVRIAIHPDIQQRGFGSQLFAQIQKQVSTNTTDMTTVNSVGVSFGADQHTLSFWLKQGLKPIHYGYKTNPRSGLRAACLMNSSHTNVAQSIDKARYVLRLNTQAQLSQDSSDDPVQNLLLSATKTTDGMRLSSVEINRLIHDFQQSRRSFTDTVGLLLHSGLFIETDAVHQSTHQMLSEYRHMPPKKRRAAEQQLRTALSKAQINDKNN